MRTFETMLFGIFWLILIGLVLRNWNGANQLLGTAVSGSTSIITVLEQR